MHLFYLVNFFSGRFETSAVCTGRPQNNGLTLCFGGVSFGLSETTTQSRRRRFTSERKKHTREDKSVGIFHIRSFFWHKKRKRNLELKTSSAVSLLCNT